MRTWIFLLFLMLLLPLASAQYIPIDLQLKVYRDGVVEVSMRIIPEEYAFQVEIPLLGKNVEGIEVTDENGEPLVYEIRGDVLVVYPEDADEILVSYYTPDLTMKEGVVWTLKVSINQTFTVVLPEGTVIVGLSDIPISLSGNTIEMPPGNQSISYVFEDIIPERRRFYTYFLIGAVIIALLVALRFWRRPKKVEEKPPEDFLSRLMREYNLNDDEIRAIKYLMEVGGGASQADVRKALDIPKTSAWRMFRRLEQRGLVKIYKKGRENWVELAIDIQNET
ncbi:helix-turn-helix transcriptional regulator [Pyrococcus yayanosii]|uniref:Sugar-specific transcriptional regulator TrmB family n=1 Tax=Pyrococcus yayanosii (strain CH1 / JCM 16557) TaxID=529709 RepID=F8AEQ0_PYRYC|nr:helix-turn-helix domain-containing protein [Pyrococcus yayanosii]AEH24732.1 Sugar-specific transcriptional regulator TrmB family [Pyrococcus yayanosii CH1]